MPNAPSVTLRSQVTLGFSHGLIASLPWWTDQGPGGWLVQSEPMTLQPHPPWN
jgi:hypothetical protein